MVNYQPMSFITPRPSEQRDKAFEMYCAGNLTHEEVGKKLGIPATTISSWSARYKWKARKVAMQLALVEPPKSMVKASTVTQEDDGLTFPEIQSEYKTVMARQALRIARVIERTPDQTLISGAEKIEKADKLARRALNLEDPQPAVVVNIDLLSRGSQPVAARALAFSETASAGLVTTDV